MRERKAPRYRGIITRWKDEQGFGFIAPDGGGPAVFVHVKAFARRGVRPADNIIVTYELGVNDKGQPRALNVAFVGERRPGAGTATPGKRVLPASIVFIGMLAVLAIADIVLRIVLFYYLGVSIVAFVAYARDKAAARADRHRTPESTLHILALLGGWPGALLAQRLLRHKSSKASFQSGFLLTVVLNCAALLWLMTPIGMRTVRALLGVA